MTENQNPNQSPEEPRSSEVKRTPEGKRSPGEIGAAEVNRTQPRIRRAEDGIWPSEPRAGSGPAYPHPQAAATPTGERKRRVPLVPAILVGAALFVVGGLAGGGIGASIGMASNGSGPSQGPGSQGGMGGPGGRSDGGQPGGQQGGGDMTSGQDDGSSADDGTQEGSSSGSGSDSSEGTDSTDDTSATIEGGSIDNAGLSRFDELLMGFAVLNRDE